MEGINLIVVNLLLEQSEDINYIYLGILYNI
jgi:hypothetical protein